jgi:hypothetical protein
MCLLWFIGYLKLLIKVKREIMTDNIEIKEMTKDDIRKLEAEHTLVAIFSGFESSIDIENFKVNASCGLIKFGGSFAQPLGHALAHADHINTHKIIKAFRKECDEHAALYIKWLEKRSE